MKIEERLINFVKKTSFSDLPEDIIQIVKKIILNNLGTIIAGSEIFIEIIRLIKSWNGKEESSILIHGGKVPAHNASFINSIMARAYDFDDVMLLGFT